MKKTAIVTGGVRRLGGLISQHLLDLGYSVISINLHKYDVNEFPILNHPDFRSYQLDLTKSSQNDIQHFIHSFSQETDWCLLINNASIFYKTSFSELTEDQLDTFYHIHIKIPLFLSQTLSTKFLQSQQEKCDIINILDVGANLFWTKYFAYSLTKNGMIHLTKLLAKELGPKIKVNGILPGWMMLDSGQNNLMTNYHKNFTVSQEPGDPKEVINLIDFIIQSKFTTGSLFTIDSGRSLL